MATLSTFFPISAQLSHYRSDDLRSDFVAGLTTAVMLVPQAMAYAMLAGLPPVAGLYASIVPLILYAVLGTSRELAVGPVAMVALLVSAGVSPHAAQGSAEYLQYAAILALLVGVIQAAMGFARLGLVTNFLSHPVLSGFTSAAAIVIGTSQLEHLFGLKLPRSSHFVDTVTALVSHLTETKWLTLGIGLGAVVLLKLMKRYLPKAPGALLVVVLGTLIVYSLRLDQLGVSVVGKVPSGLPMPSLPSLNFTQMGTVFQTAMTIALVGFMESIAVARAFARRQKYDVAPNQELIGLGVANLAASLFQAFPVTGGFSRTAINAQAGARSGVASMVTAVMVALTLFFLTPLFTYLPKAVLAAIILVAVAQLVDVHEVKHLWKVKRADLALLIITFVATLTLDIEQGIMIGVGSSILFFVVRTTRPHTAVLGRLPGTNTYRNVRRHQEAETLPGILILRIDAQFYFGNVTFLKETLKDLERSAQSPLKAVILDASSVNQLDSSADAALHEIVEDYKARGIRFLLAGVKGPVHDVMVLSGLEAKLGPDAFHLEVAGAVELASQVR